MEAPSPSLAVIRTKATLDRVVAVVTLPFVALVMAAIAVAIKLDDGGTVFFRQTRAGLNGKPFRIWKFRSMVPNAWEIGHGYVPADLELVTRVGRFLRSTSLDELPQILNILRGEMSFVGPRPTLPSQVERYSAEQRWRLLVKPGIVGWAQLHGRAALPWSRRIEYDIEYVRHASIRFDLEIILRSIPMVLGGTGVTLYERPDDVDDLGGRPDADP
jgi:undecaprenyl phosphate N,N'-diacetylbacillosamine 1-phosphate transferase